MLKALEVRAGAIETVQGLEKGATEEQLKGENRKGVKTKQPEGEAESEFRLNGA